METWSIVDEQLAVQQQPHMDQIHFQVLGRKVRASLKLGQKRREEKTWAGVEALLVPDPPLGK